MRPSARRISTTLAAIALVGLAASCSSDSEEGNLTDDGQAVVSSDEQATNISVTDGWAKGADEGMSAAFGIIHNGSDAEVTVVAVSSNISDDMQLHEVVGDADGNMVMQEKDGGFTIPAGSDYVLEPGGNHLMFMDLDEPLQPGDSVTLTLEFEDGSTFEFEAPVKDYTGADENYAHNEDMDQMDHGDDEGHGDGADD